MKKLLLASVAMIAASQAVAIEINDLEDRLKSYGITMSDTQIQSVLDSIVETDSDFNDYMSALDDVEECVTISCINTAKDAANTAYAAWDGTVMDFRSDAMSNLRTEVESIASTAANNKITEAQDFLSEWGDGTRDTVKYFTEYKTGKSGTNAEQAYAGLNLTLIAVDDTSTLLDGGADITDDVSFYNRTDAAVSSLVQAANALEIAEEDDLTSATSHYDAIFNSTDDNFSDDASAWWNSADNVTYTLDDDGNVTLEATASLETAFTDTTVSEVIIADVNNTDLTKTFVIEVDNADSDVQTNYTFSDFE